MRGKNSGQNGAFGRRWGRRLSLCAVVAMMAQGATAASDPRVVARYREMLAANPVEGTALERLWKLASEEGTTEQLLKSYAAAGKEGDLASQLVYGHLLRRAGRGDEALDAFRRAAEIDPKSPLPPLALAPALAPKEKALELEKAVALLPKEARQLPPTLEALGEAWLAAGSPEKAMEAWEAMLALTPDSLSLRQQLATTCAKNGMNEAALRHLAVLIEKGDAPVRADALRQQALLLEKEGRAPEALEALGKAMALSAPGHWQRADLLNTTLALARRSGQVATLEAQWKAQAQAHPRQVVPWQQLAALYEADGQREALRGALETLLQLTPKDRATALRLARLLSQSAKPQEAVAAWERVTIGPGEIDLALERALLDLRLGQSKQAAARLAPLLAHVPKEEREEVAARLESFYRQHQMFDALEAHLSRPQADPGALAEFLFSRQRFDEARATLERLAPADAPPAQQAAGWRRAADLLRHAGLIAEAIAAMEKAVALEPRERGYQLHLGDLLLTPGGSADPERGEPTPADRIAARRAFEAAFTLSQTAEEQQEADQRLFRSYSQAGATPEGEEGTLLSAAGKAAAKVLEVPVETYRFTAPEPVANPALAEALEERKKEASTSPEAMLRLARWYWWKRDLPEAAATIANAIAQKPDSIEAQELALLIAQGRNDPEAVRERLNRLLELAPEQKKRWLKEIAQNEIQLGRTKAALEIYETLAAEGDPAALSDLANAQQQNGLWYDALGTWQRLYTLTKTTRRQEVLQPLVRVMHHLSMHEKALATLWEAYMEEGDAQGRNLILKELIAYSQQQQAMPWLLEKLRDAVATQPAHRMALGQTLKADGEEEAAYREWQQAALTASDRAEAEAFLVREAEAGHDYQRAATHQKLRIDHFPNAQASEWTKLAALQLTALDQAGALATMAQITRHFPRDAETLLWCARALLENGERELALAVTRGIFYLDPANASAAILLLRLDPNGPEALSAARAILAGTRSPSLKEQLSIILPPAPAMIGNRLRTLFTTLNGPVARLGHRSALNVELYNERHPGRLERDWRLEAIRALAPTIPLQERDGWIAKMAKGGPSEKLWACYGTGAKREVADEMLRLAAEHPGHPGVRAGLVWTLMELEAWRTLAHWLWNPERSGDDHEAFRSVLREWGLLHRPLDLEALFLQAPLAWVQPCAELLAAHERLPEAVALAEPVFDALPGQRGDFGLPLAEWMLSMKDRAGAIRVLETIAQEPSDSLSTPTYHAQRYLFELLPRSERQRWMATRLADNSRSPLHATLTRALLHALAGNRQETEAALDALLTLRAAQPGEAPVLDRIWRFLLATGVQFEAWNLDHAAIYLWEKAIEDQTAIRLQGEQAVAFADEIATRLATLQLRRLPEKVALREVELKNSDGSLPPARLNQVATMLENTGRRPLALKLFALLNRDQPVNPAMRLLSSALNAKDSEAAKASVEAWLIAPERDIISTQSMIEYLSSYDLPQALEVTRRLMAEGQGDQRLPELEARILAASRQWPEAKAAYARLLEIHPDHPVHQLAYLQCLIETGERAEALRRLHALPDRGGDIDGQRVALYLKAGALPQARQIAWQQVSNDQSQSIIRFARTLFDHGAKEDALIYLNAAVTKAQEGGKSRQAFDLAMAVVELAGKEHPLARPWLKRMRLLADRPDLLTLYYTFTRERGWLPAQERAAELRQGWEEEGDTVAGSWLVADLLDHHQPEAAARMLEALLQRPDIPQNLLVWLQKVTQAAHRHDLALSINAVLQKRYPGMVELTLARMRSLQALGQREAALKELDAAIPLTLFKPQWSGELALEAWSLHARPQAKRLFEAAAAADPAARGEKVALGYVDLLLEEGELPHAKRLLRLLHQNEGTGHPEVVETYLRRAQRTGAKELEGELRDLQLPPMVEEEVKRRLTTPDAPEAAPENEATATP